MRDFSQESNPSSVSVKPIGSKDAWLAFFSKIVQTKPSSPSTLKSKESKSKSYCLNMNFTVCSVSAHFLLRTAQTTFRLQNFVICQHLETASRHLAERVGFEPTEGFPSAVFKTASLDHSDISPLRVSLGSLHSFPSGRLRNMVLNRLFSSRCVAYREVWLPRFSL